MQNPDEKGRKISTEYLLNQNRCKQVVSYEETVTVNMLCSLFQIYTNNNDTFICWWSLVIYD